jgi:hypothetical protein
MLAPFFGLGGCLELLVICNREHLSLNFLIPSGTNLLFFTQIKTEKTR